VTPFAVLPPLNAPFHPSCRPPLSAALAVVWSRSPASAARKAGLVRSGASVRRLTAHEAAAVAKAGRPELV